MREDTIENGSLAGDATEGSPAEIHVNKENSAAEASCGKAGRRSIKDFIHDKPFRIRSYLRRRPIPLKRCLELDVQCGTKSFHLQVSPDIDEAVYCGAPELVALFLRPEGLRLSHVCRLLAAGGGQAAGGQGDLEDLSDEDFYDSIKSRNKREKEARAESAKRMAEVDYLRSPLERAKKFKSGKDGIFAKMSEIEEVCGVLGFTVIVNPEKELCAYSGDPGLITDFFTRGLSRAHMASGRWNVRQFDCEEVEYNVCSVPACVVSRNTLGKWRQAALDLFQFPPGLALSLHPCPARQRDRWMAELDLEPHNKARVVVCSLHFRDGRPTNENPFPTELLGEPCGREPPRYRGRRPEEEQTLPGGEAATGAELIGLVMAVVNSKIDQIEQSKQEEEAKQQEREEQRRGEIQAHRGVRYRRLAGRPARPAPPRPAGVGKRTRARRRRLRSGLQCRFCPASFGFTRALFHHVTGVHCPAVELRPAEEERAAALASLYPADLAARRLDPKKKYVCAVCKSVCDLLGLFVHMKQVHHGLLCQYCLKLFKKVRDLEHHLSASHRLPSRYYSSFGRLAELSGREATLACGECSVLLSVQQAEQHHCSVRRHFECPLCRQVEPGQAELERHLARCPRLPGGAGTARQQAVRLLVLTGNRPVAAAEPLPPPPSAPPEEPRPAPAPLPAARRPVFSCSDRGVLVRYTAVGQAARPDGRPVLEGLPGTGTIFWGTKSRGISNHVKKEFKDVGMFIDLAGQIKKAGKAVGEVDEEVLGLRIERAGKHLIVSQPRPENAEGVDEEEEEDDDDDDDEDEVGAESPEAARPEENLNHRLESRPERVARLETEISESLAAVRAAIGRETACLFCQQCKTVWVEATFLLSHLVVAHQGGEVATGAIQRIKRLQRDTRGREVMFRFTDTDQPFTFGFYRCSYCSTEDCASYTDLFAHTSTAHNTNVLKCNICQNMFLNYGSLISHVCYGPPTGTAAKPRFACKVCHRTDLSSFLEFQAHLRSDHHTCEICFQSLGDQRSLHEHCASHDQDCFCLQCFNQFEKADSFKKHLMLKHGSEAKDCGQCYAPTWPHVYHFCQVDQPITCRACHLTLPDSSAYRVHQRRHTGVQPHACTDCSKRFISKSLLWKHQVRRHPGHGEASRGLAAKKLRKDCQRLGARGPESVEAVQAILSAWLGQLLEDLVPPEEPEPEPARSPPPTAAPASALDAAIASIMPDSGREDPPAAPRPDIFPPPDRAAIQASIAERTYTPDTSWQAGLDALLAGAAAPVASSGSDASPQKPPAGPATTAVMGGLWNQDLAFITSPKSRRGAAGGLRTLQPQAADPSPVSGIRTLEPAGGARPAPTSTQWDLDLSESSGDEEESGPQKRRMPAMKQRQVAALRPLLDHDYCYAAFLASQQPVQPAVPAVQEMSEMDKILKNVAMGDFSETVGLGKEKLTSDRTGEKKKKKKKKKKRRKKQQLLNSNKREQKSDSSSDSESDIDVVEAGGKVDMFGIQARQKLAPGPATPDPRGRPRKEAPSLLSTPGPGKRGPKPKYYTPEFAAKSGGVVAGRARPSFDTDSSGHGSSDSETVPRRAEQPQDTIVTVDDVPSNSESMGSSDMETDFEAEEQEPAEVASKPFKAPRVSVKTPKQPAPKQPAPKPALKLKIKLPPQPEKRKGKQQGGPGEPRRHKVAKRRRSSGAEGARSQEEKDGRPISKKMRESLALNSRARLPSSGSEEERAVPAVRVPGTKLYCYCQCPHDEVSEMIGCDAPDCLLEWFHFECVGILVPPEGTWYCPQCTKRHAQ